MMTYKLLKIASTPFVKDQDFDEVVANLRPTILKNASALFPPTVTTAPLLSRDSIRVAFTLEDRKTRGLVNGFGAIFTNVQKKGTQWPYLLRCKQERDLPT